MTAPPRGASRATPPRTASPAAFRSSCPHCTHRVDIVRHFVVFFPCTDGAAPGAADSDIAGLCGPPARSPCLNERLTCSKSGASTGANSSSPTLRATTTRRNILFTPADHQAASCAVRQTLREHDSVRFERAAIAASAELGKTAMKSQPAHRRYLSQSLDQEAVRRGLLLRAHWHCPSLWRARQPVDTRLPPNRLRPPRAGTSGALGPLPRRLRRRAAHPDGQRGLRADRRGQPRRQAPPPSVRPHRLAAPVPTRAGPSA